jgi:nucleotide-binding universal stress UspA family protein
MTDPRDGILRPNKILLATDGSSDAELAARVAADLAHETNAELHVAHAWHHNVQGFGYPAMAWTDYSYLYEREARKMLATQVDAIEAAGGVVAEPHLLQGRTIDVLLDLCEELQPGLLVMGSRGLGPIGRLVVGSVSEGVVHHARVPVLVVRGGDAAWPPGRVISGDDGSEGAGRAAEMAAGIARLYSAGDLLVRAHRNPPEPIGGWSAEDRLRLDEARAGIERSLDERADALGRTEGRRPETRAMDGDATLALLVAAEEGDELRTLISVGSRGLGVIGRARLGSVSTNILRVAMGPVLICPLSNEAAAKANREAARATQPVQTAP